MPNVGCLLGTAYQIQLALLNSSLRNARLNISPAEYLILRGLYSEDGLQQCDLSDLLGKDKASVSRCVAAMERKGLVRTECISHKCRRVWLTEMSKVIKPEIMEIARQRHDALLNIANKEDMDAFVRVLKQMVNLK